MRFELINPSDKYEFDAPTQRAAAALCLVVGHGQYIAEPLDDKGKEVPCFLFGGAAEWFARTFGVPIDSYLDSPDGVAEIVPSLRSLLIPGEGTQDQLRSSMNNIGGYARAIADAIEAKHRGAA